MMREDNSSHMGFPQGAPQRATFPDGGFIEPVPEDEQCNLNKCFALVGLSVIALGVLLILLLVAVFWTFFTDLLPDSLVFYVLIPVVVFLVLFYFFCGHLLKFLFIRMVRSRPERLFEPTGSCIYAPLEDPNTFKKMKLNADDHALMFFTDNWLYIEMTAYRAKLSTKALSLSKKIVG